MTTESPVGTLLTREVNARVRRNTFRMATVVCLANAGVMFALWNTATAKADADMRREIAKLSDNYLRRETAAVQGVTDAATQQTAKLQEACGEVSRTAGQTQGEVDRLHAALMEKLLQSERIAMALDEQKAALSASTEKAASRRVAATN